MNKQTDEQIIEILATKGMGWTKPEGCMYWYRRERGSCDQVADCSWNPLTDLNACHEVEKRLSLNHRFDYEKKLAAALMGTEEGLGWQFLHATAPVKARALAEVLSQ